MTRRNFEMLFCCSAEVNWRRQKTRFTKSSHASAAVATWSSAKDDGLASFFGILTFYLEVIDWMRVEFHHLRNLRALNCLRHCQK